MSYNIALSSSMRSNLLSLRNIATQMNKTQNILSTGLRVNSAIDNATSYYQARSLTNRAKDLNNLLDSMSQGIQTIQATMQGLESANAYLEQALVILNEVSGLSTETIPKTELVPITVQKEGLKDKSYLEKQDKVFTFTNRNGETISSVVTNAEDLLDAVNSGIAGNIIVYGEIDMGTNEITLNDNQNLVGVDKYRVGNLYQYSKLKFSGADYGISAGNNSEIGWLDIDANVKVASECSAIKVIDKSNVSLQNIDITFYAAATTSNLGGGIYIAGDSMVNAYGEINVIATGTQRSHGIYVKGSSELNLYDAKVGAITKGQKHCFSFMVGNSSQVNLYGSSELHSANLNSDSNLVSGNSNSRFNLKSADAKMYLTGNKVFYGSNGNNGDSCISVVKGATIIIGSKKYVAKNDANDILMKTGNNPNSTYNKNNQFTQSSATTAEKNYASSVISYIQSANFTTNQNTSTEYEKYYYEEIKYIEQIVHISEFDCVDDYQSLYEQILNEYKNMLIDSSYLGCNLLAGCDKKINFNEDGSNSFIIKGLDLINTVFSSEKWTNSEDVNKSIKEIKNIIETITNFSKDLGNSLSIIQTRQSFTEALSYILETGADDLVLADMNEASAEYLMLQTRQQLATNSLSLAAQSAQSILKLF